MEFINRAMQRAAILAAVLWAAPPALSTACRADTLDAFAAPPSPLAMGPLLYTAKNWSGYAAETDFAAPASDTVTAVTGAWIVPAVSPPSNPAANVSGQMSDCAVWVGIDGFSDSTVEQVGTLSYVESGFKYYYAWYEMYPNAMVPINSFTIRPGDSMTASVVYGLPGYANEFQLSIADNTTGKSDTVYETSSPTAERTSAEWIVEAPTSGTSILPLPRFGSATFTAATATIGGTTGPIDDYSSWQVSQINMVDKAWDDAMTPAAITDAGSAASSSFTVYQAPEPSALAMLAAAAGCLVLCSAGRMFVAGDKPGMNAGPITG